MSIKWEIEGQIDSLWGEKQTDDPGEKDPCEQKKVDYYTRIYEAQVKWANPKKKLGHRSLIQLTL